jgi:hypothetical protein
MASIRVRGLDAAFQTVSCAVDLSRSADECLFAMGCTRGGALLCASRRQSEHQHRPAVLTKSIVTFVGEKHVVCAAQLAAEGTSVQLVDCSGDVVAEREIPWPDVSSLSVTEFTQHIQAKCAVDEDDPLDVLPLAFATV